MEIEKTALVVIDLQQGILENGQWQPYSNIELFETNHKLGEALKEVVSLSVLVNVDPRTMKELPANAQMRAIEFPENYKELLLPLVNEQRENVITVTKHNPGAFFGTDLDVQLRRRKIETIILTGVSTSMGVYATALEAYQHGYQVVVIEDACGDRELEIHQLFFEKIFPRIATIYSKEQLLKILALS